MVSKAKMPTIKTLKKQCHEYWSKIVRLRDMHKCQMCGSEEYLQAHHCIVTKKNGGSTRYDTRNGVCLCYGCHIGKIHGGASQDWIGRYWMKVNALVPIEIQEDIKLQSNKYFSTTNKTVHLEIRESLKKELIELEELRLNVFAEMSTHI